MTRDISEKNLWRWSRKGAQGERDNLGRLAMQPDPHWVPMLAHERLDRMVDGFGDICRHLADQARQAPASTGQCR